jgi:LacI family repressor for deo operon, udp, cdd, tsx, nupC, and nupG
VNAHTAERIRAIAHELGYRRTPFAPGVALTPSHILGIVVPDITNPFYFEIIRGAESAAAEAGYTLLLADTQESQRMERLALARAIPTVAGIMLTSTRMSDAGIRTHAKQRPLVVLNRAVTGVPCVVTDNAHGARQTVEHLVGLGHRVITYVAGPEASWADGSRWLGVRDAASEVGARARRIGPFAPTVDAGLYAAQLVTDHRTSAVVCYNDLLAVGVLRGLRLGGVAVPAEVSVVSFDNTMIADLVEPGLTTVAAPLHALGSTGVHHLVAHLRGVSPTLAEPVVLPTRLVVRGSTAQATPRRPAA